jgi:hypothetical protein
MLILAGSSLASLFQLQPPGLTSHIWSPLWLTVLPQYSKHDRPYVLPHILTGPEVVLPVSQARWLCEQPDNVLSQVEVNRRFLEADHTFFHPNIVREPIHPKVIKHELTHKLNNFADGIVNELQSCLEEDWGLDTEGWRVVNLYETMLDIISRLSMRVLIGKELCRNKEFLASARNFDRKVALSAAAINLLPEFLKPYVQGGSFTWLNR